MQKSCWLTTIFFLIFFLALFLPMRSASLPRAVQPALATASEPAKASWREKWNDTTAAAKKEGAVVVYSSASGVAVRQALVSKVKELFGINMEVVVAPGDQLTQKIITERQRGLNFADAFIAGTQIVTPTYAGIFTPADRALILPDASDPKAWPEGKLPFIDKNKLTLALTGAYWSYILVNTDLVKPGELKSYADLVNPKWKGKLIMFDPAGGGAASYWVYFMTKLMGQEKGERFLRQLASQQDLMLTKDARLQGEWVARGKYPVAIAASMGVVTPLLKAKAPVSWVRMSEGGLVHPSASVFGLVDKAPHPNAAMVLFNWLLTPEGQHVFSQAFGQPATRLGVSTEGLDPFNVPRPEEKAFRIDEKFILEVEAKGRGLGKEIFGHLLQ